MSKTDTWMPLYIADYLGDTMHLNGAQHGAYLLLLMHHWRNGPLPDDEAQLASIARTDINVWRKAIAPIVMKFFDLGDEGFTQKRLIAERDFASDLTDKRAIAGKAGATKRWGKDSKKVAGGNGGPDGNRYDKDDGKPIANAMANSSQVDGPLPTPLPRKEERISLASQARRSVDLDAAVFAWNEIAETHGLSRVHRLTDARTASLRKRLAECGGIEGWQEAMRLITQSPFLLGQSGEWKADFDFVLQAKSFTKLMEGTYGNRGSKQPASKLSWMHEAARELH
jgi:uncharacterized protein YdaU (DUF1376 family)